MQAADRGGASALLALAKLRKQAGGDTARAEALYRHAVDRIVNTASAEALTAQAAGRDDSALFALAVLREQAGDTARRRDPVRAFRQWGRRQCVVGARHAAEAGWDTADAENPVVQAADPVVTGALEALVELRKRAGDAVGADHIRRFGLSGSGEIATGLYFESPTPGMSG